MDRALAGKLLVASPTLTDPNFARAVVLMIAHDTEGAFGVILNRPIEAPLAEHVPSWAPFATPPAVIFQGGPVQVSSALGLASADVRSHTPGWTQVIEGVGLFDLESAPGTTEPPSQLRVFGGYAGWGAGQLDGEIEAGAWFIVDAEPDDAFTREPGTLWRRVLRRQDGQLAMFAYFPESPGQN